MRRHPTRRDLFRYAESLSDNRATVSAKLASHVTSCPVCAVEAGKIRASLECAASAAGIEPTFDFTQHILEAARRERATLATRPSQVRSIAPVFRALGYAAALLLIGAFCFHAATDSSAVNPESPGTASLATVSASAPRTIVQPAAGQIESLVTALSHPSGAPQTLAHREHRRSAHALTHDLAAAQAALERNPGCSRATLVIDATLERQAESLRNLYIETNL